MVVRRMAWLAALAVAVGGCEASVLLPFVEPDGVTIELAVSGGIAGVEYSFVVDGSRGEVWGRSCSAGCSFQPGETLALVSEDQVADLARRLDESGVMGMDGRDFGTTCCDLFHLRLTYDRRGDIVRVRGTDDRFPEELRAVTSLLRALGEGRVPILVSPETREADWPRDPYTLGRVDVVGLTLSAEVTYGGGCGAHPMDLVAWGGWMESFPVQINALITHDDQDDPCDAVVTETRRFDLQSLARAYEEAYGPIGEERPTVILRLWDPLGAGPVGRLIEVRL